MPKKIADMVKDGRLTSAHGRTLLAIKDEQQMLRLAKRVVKKEKWSVRYLENHVNELKNVSSKSETDKVDITKPKFYKATRTTVARTVWYQSRYINKKIGW